MTKNIVFIDSRVADHEKPIASLGADTEWVLLNAQEDGVLQVQRALAGDANLDSIQIISHGSAGALYLGSTVLDSGNLHDYASQLQAIGSSLTATGDILLYGCNVAAGDLGLGFIQSLAAITGADVAASDDASGSQVQGGDSLLEVAVGAIESSVIDLSALGATLAVIAGTEGSDTLEGTVDNDTILGGAGSDQITGSGGDDYIEGGDELDNWSGDYIEGGPGNDTVLGGAGRDSLDGNAGDDRVEGGDGDDSLRVSAGGGNDTLAGGTGNDSFNLWLYDNNRAQTVRVCGGDGDDLIQAYVANWAGGDESIVATGGAGKDTYSFHGGDGAYRLTVTDFAAGAGGDLLDVSSLLDHSAAQGRGYQGGNPMSAANGYLRLVQDGASTLLQYDEDGAAGTAYSWHTAITLQNVNAAMLTADNFVGAIPPDGSDVAGLQLVGTENSDTLQGSYFNDTLLGGADSDQITGSGGDDYIEGGDELDNWSGDYIEGGPGNDTVLGGAGRDSLDGNAGDDRVEGGDGDDSLRVSAGGGNDTLAGGTGNDSFNLWLYDNNRTQTVRVYGGDGDDLIRAYVANWAGGDDSIVATGGAGKDTYSFYSGNAAYRLTVTDFAAGAGGDLLDVSALLDHSAADGRGYQGGNPMNAANGYLRLVQDGANTLLQYDEDGAAGTAYTWHTAITLQNVNAATLTADNFVGAIPPDGSDVTGLQLVGTDNSDTLQGSYFNDTLLGGDGSDQITGSGGDDYIEGGDELDGWSWSGDRIQGGPGNDTILGGAGSDDLDGNAGDDRVEGGNGDDYLSVNGGEGNDTLIGGAGKDTFSLWVYDNNRTQTVRVYGGDGDDLIRAYVANWAGGDDSIVATGGAGKDTYSFYSGNAAYRLTVTDFAAGAGGDLLDVSALLDHSAADGRGYQGGNPMNAANGYLRLVQDGASTLLQYDEDGAAGTAYSWHTAITLQNIAVSAINAHNFKPLTIEGTAGDDVLNGSLGVDTLTGGAGHDVLDGGWGGDAMLGGTGNDTYHVDSLGDLVKEVAGEGVDKVIATIDYVMAGNVESLVLGSGASKGTGNALNNVMQANDAGNELIGGAGNDRLKGGKGKDVLYAGSGNDHVDAGDGNDLIVGGDGAGNDTYIGGAGTDTVKYTSATSKITVNLATGAASGADIGVDALSLIENIIGGQSGDSLTGSAGNNVINGYTGADSMTGGLGNDTYYVDNIGDVITESSDIINGGTDTVIASVTRTLGNYQENLTLSGSAAINGTGNALANRLVGNDAANALNGRAGADTMIGGNGNDTYYVDHASDVVSETSSAGGIDTVVATVSRTLGANQENLTLGGSGVINGTGNALANRLIGNGAANVLTGGAGNDTLSSGAGNDRLVGGTGKDLLTGGTGNDIFDFNALNETGLTSTAWDVITDFTRGQDKIDLSTLDANTATTTNDAFSSVIGSTTAVTAAGQLKVVNGVLYGNTDADSTAEFAIQLTGISSLSTSDFIL